MKHIKRFNENHQEKQFLVLDKSGRGAKVTLSKGDIESSWDLSEEDWDSEVTLAEYLDEAELGDKWSTNNTEITCI